MIPGLSADLESSALDYELLAAHHAELALESEQHRLAATAFATVALVLRELARLMD